MPTSKPVLTDQAIGAGRVFMPERTYNFVHCDVFASRPYTGNSLAVFPDASGLSREQMQAITQELRHFESVFLTTQDGAISARVFDLFEELPFAGHPLIGAACILHERASGGEERSWSFRLGESRNVTLETVSREGRFSGRLDQGRPEMIGMVGAQHRLWFAEAFNLNGSDLADLPLEIISTGLKYLVIPVTCGLDHAGICIPDLGDRLTEFGAEFAYLFDVTRFEGRHWNNDGALEYVATGSAAGVIGAYALRHGLVAPNRPFTLAQGRFMGRPSAIEVTPFGSSQQVERVTVAGDVSIVGRGTLVAP